MRSLLDVNVLIALLDADHTLHGRAMEWFRAEGVQGWATCPITQNGCIRIMSHPSYPNAIPIHLLTGRLAAAAAGKHHEFWPDDVSVLDPGTIDTARIHSSRQLTDVYLVALAVRHEGRFVTFDAGIPLGAVRGADKRRLLVL